MNKNLIFIILTSSMLLTACDKEQATSNDEAVAIVNGTYISKASLTKLEKEMAKHSRDQSFPKEQLVEELVQREILIQDAVHKKLDQSVEFSERLTTIKNSLLSQAAIQNYLKSNPVTDIELEAEYNKNKAESGTEYKARHILVKTEEEARQLIVKLTKGADFVELAKNKSTGPSSSQGGDLGWFGEGQMVAPFSEAVVALEDNKFTTEPVQSQFGWHVILREGSREQTPPPFESVKKQLRPMLQRQKIQDFLESLRKQAKIEILLPAEAETTNDKPAEAVKEVAVTEEKTVETDAKKEATDVIKP